MVPQRMSWLVLLLGWPGLVARGCPLAGLMAGGVALMAWAAVPHGLALMVVLVAMHVLLALCAADIRGWELGLRGMAPGPVVMAHDADDARLRLMHAHVAHADAPSTPIA
ncbi:hypothetical protein CFR73_03560 [Novacetimonas maltaceti]|nr:hypothetical protein CFR73_03560 [Novacetimonas maltaceti]